MDVTDTATWLPLDQLEPGFDANKTPPSAALAGRTLQTVLDGGDRLRFRFTDARTLGWEALAGPRAGRAGVATYEALEAADGLYLVMFEPGDERHTATALVLDDHTGRVLSVVTRIGPVTPGRPACDQEFRPGVVTGQPPSTASVPSASVPSASVPSAPGASAPAPSAPAPSAPAPSGPAAAPSAPAPSAPVPTGPAAAPSAPAPSGRAGPPTAATSGSAAAANGPTGEPPAPSTDLVGRRVLWVYSDDHAYEHVYLSPRWYTWQCLAGPERGLADTDPCAVWRVRPEVYVVTWREKVVPCAATLVCDHNRMRSHGMLFGLGAGGSSVRFTFGAHGRLLSETRHPDRYDPRTITA